MNEQLNLLGDEAKMLVDNDGQPPSGAHYHEYFLSEIAQHALVDIIDKMPWMNDLRRRVQHYGFKYDYSQRDIEINSRLGPLPIWLEELEQTIRSALLSSELRPDVSVPFSQAIVNEYLPGQGIAPHVDRNCFGPVVATVSLGSDINMDFEHPSSGENYSQRLSKGSLLALGGDARWTWRHGIAKRKTDRLASVNIPRKRRISITFRTVPE